MNENFIVWSLINKFEEIATKLSTAIIERDEARDWARKMKAERDTLQNQLDRIPRGHLIENIHELEEQLAAALERAEKAEAELASHAGFLLSHGIGRKIEIPPGDTTTTITSPDIPYTTIKYPHEDSKTSE